MCDYRRLNQNTVQVGYPMALLKDLLQRLNGCTIITLVDMKDWFYNLMVDEETGLLTSFVTNEPQYLMERLGQGIKQSLGLFNHAMNKIFAPIEKKALFLDDMAVIDNDIKEHYRSFSCLLN